MPVVKKTVPLPALRPVRWYPARWGCYSHAKLAWHGHGSRHRSSEGETRRPENRTSRPRRGNSASRRAAAGRPTRAAAAEKAKAVAQRPDHKDRERVAARHHRLILGAPEPASLRILGATVSG